MPGFSGCLQQLVAYEVPMHYQNYTTLLKKTDFGIFNGLPLARGGL